MESKKGHDIPFGVRAIQSGIQVDGIWISKTNTPAASNLGFGSSGTSPEMLPSPDSKNRTVSNIKPLSKQATQPQYLPDLDILQRYDDAQALKAKTDGARAQGAYKPRTVSHLRHGSAGPYDEATLHHLEGNTIQKKVHVHRPRHSSSRFAEVEGESSAADNELSSGVSSRSDTSLSRHIEEDAKSSTVVSDSEVQSPAGMRSSRAEYFSVPVESPSSDTVNPFQTPLASPRMSDLPLVVLSESEDHLAHPQESFKAGELHMNKSVRKVNSGFEVLPAGTFGASTDLKGKGLESDVGEDSGERRHSKLQKKARTSMTGKRTSMGIDRS